MSPYCAVVILQPDEYIPSLLTVGHLPDFMQRGAHEVSVVWFIAYRHSRRPDEAGIKFVPSEAETVIERLRLESHGYVITKVAQTSNARMRAFLADNLAYPDTAT